MKPVSAKKIDSSIQIMREVIAHASLNPFAFCEALYSAIHYLESYKKATARRTK